MKYFLKTWKCQSSNLLATISILIFSWNNFDFRRSIIMVYVVHMCGWFSNILHFSTLCFLSPFTTDNRQTKPFFNGETVAGSPASKSPKEVHYGLEVPKYSAKSAFTNALERLWIIQICKFDYILLVYSNSR